MLDVFSSLEAWGLDMTELSYFHQGCLCLLLTLGACLPVWGCLQEGQKDEHV